MSEIDYKKAFETYESHYNYIKKRAEELQEENKNLRAENKILRKENKAWNEVYSNQNRRPEPMGTVHFNEKKE